MKIPLDSLPDFRVCSDPVNRTLNIVEIIHSETRELFFIEQRCFGHLYFRRE